MTRGVEESPGKRTESFLSWCLHSSNIFSGRVMASSTTYSLCFSRNSSNQGVRWLEVQVVLGSWWWMVGTPPYSSSLGHLLEGSCEDGEQLLHLEPHPQDHGGP